MTYIKIVPCCVSMDMSVRNISPDIELKRSECEGRMVFMLYRNGVLLNYCPMCGKKIKFEVIE